MKSVRTEFLVWIHLVLLVGIWSIILCLTGTGFSIGWEALSKLPDVVTVYVFLLFAFTKWAWRWRIFRRWLIRLPDLQGTWRGTVRSTWVDPSTGKTVPEKRIVLVIKQTFAAVSVAMYSEESDSFSTTAQINEDDDSGVFRLTYNFSNRPRVTVRDRSAMHDGAAILKVVLRPRRELAGEYWTSRTTTGELSVVFESKQLAQKFS